MATYDQAQSRGGSSGKFLLILTLLIIGIVCWFSVQHALDGHSDSASWVSYEAAKNDPCWSGTNSNGRTATVGKFQQNGDDKFGLCFEEPGVDGEMEYITSYPSSKGVLQEIIDTLLGRGFK